VKTLLLNCSQTAADILVKISAFGLVAMTAIIGWQVFGRYVLHSSPSWSEQAALALMIWYVFLAAAAGVREGFHIRIVALENAVKPQHKQLLNYVVNILTIACGISMCIWGSELVTRTWSHTIPSLGIPRGLAYASLPISGLLIILFSIEKLIEPPKTKVEDEKEDQSWN